MKEKTTSIRIWLFVDIAGDLVLINVFIPQPNVIIDVRVDDFRVQDKNGLPGVETLLDGIAKQLAKEQEEAKAIQQEARLVYAFLSAHLLLPKCISAKKKFDPNVPLSFEDACQFPRWGAVIGREYTALIMRNTWSFRLQVEAM